MMSASEGVSIPQLLHLFRESFSESDFNELQETLVDREENMKMEIRDLKMDLAEAKVDTRLLESSQSLAELERTRLEIKLRRSESRCNELNEKLVILSQEYKVSCDRAKRAQDYYANDICEKVKEIFELKNIIAESEQLVVELKRKQSEADEEVAELKRKQSEADEEVAELKRQNSEATQRLDESRREKMECDRKIQDMGERLMKVESGLGNILNVRVKDLVSLTDFVDKTAAVGEKVDLPDMIRGWKDSLGNDCTNADAQNVAVVVGATSNATESDDTPLVMKELTRGIHGSPSVHNSSSQDNEGGKATDPTSTIAPHVSVDAPTSFSKWSNARKSLDGRIEEDLETKKRRVLAGGSDAGSSHACDVCNVVYKSAASFNSHLAGPKHASMLRRRAYKAGE